MRSENCRKTKTRMWSVKYQFRDPDYIDDRDTEAEYTVVAPNVKCAVDKASRKHHRGHSRGIHEVIAISMIGEA